MVAHLLEFAPHEIRDACAIGEGAVHDELRLSLRRVGTEYLASQPGLLLHAAGCIFDGSGLLLAGTSRSGKSTFAALVASRGGAVVADDTVRLDGARAFGIGTPISVRQDSPFRSHAQGTWYADSSSDRLLIRADDLGGSHVPDMAVDAIAFVRFGSDYSLAHLSPGDSFARVASMMLRPAEQPELFAVAELVGARPCVEVAISTLAEADTALEALADLPTPDSVTIPTTMTASELVGFDDEVWGVRFGDEVVLFHRTKNQAAHYVGWEAGLPMSDPRWPLR